MTKITNQNYPNGLNPLGYMGVNAPTPGQQVVQLNRAPTVNDSQNFTIGTQWLATVGAVQEIWELVDLSGGVATWVQLYPGGGGGGGANSFPTDAGTANEAGGVLNIFGDGININTAGAGNTVTVSLDTNITVTSITDTSLGAGVVLSDAGGLLSSSAGIAGQVLTSNGAGVAPTFQNEAAGGAVTGLSADNAVTALPIAGVIDIAGGTGITTAAAGNVVTVNLTSPVSIAHGGTNATSMATTFGVNYFDGTRLVTTAVGTAGQVLTSNGIGVAPTFQAGGGGGGITTLTANTGVAATAASIKLQGNNVIATNGASISEIDFSLTNGTNGQVLIGGGANPIWASITAGTNITLTPGANSLTIAATGTSPAASCAFFYYQATRASNVIGTSTFYSLGATVVMTSLYDNTGGAVTPGNGAGTPLQFTAPATGLYYFSTVINTQIIAGTLQLPSVQISITGNIATANNYFGYSQSTGTTTFPIYPGMMDGMFYMTAGDVAIFQVTRFTNGSLNGHVNGTSSFSSFASAQATWISGYRVA